jgi:hypothetical protein
MPEGEKRSFFAFGRAKTPLALSPGPFFGVLVRWASAFLIGFDHFLPGFDRNLIPFGGIRIGFDHLMLYALV